jgi:hypothetical protein
MIYGIIKIVDERINKAVKENSNTSDGSYQGL